ncbi:MAG: BRCT domain-containing protein [Deltaproteobacteria bacterium]|nr:BRCT domain-containing protein [Deltaproteobacteria bacterium]
MPKAAKTAKPRKPAAKAKKPGATDGKKFLFTGKLASMTRSQAAAWVTDAGGQNAGSVSKDLDYLVVGDSGSFLYGAGSKGDKTLAAEKLQARGSAVKIISETDFLVMVGAPAPTTPARPQTKVGPVKVTVEDGGGTFDPVGKKFMFTGKLAAMTREEARSKVEAIGGVPAGSVSKDLDYLVVGDQGSHLFGAGAKGDKILSAEKLQANGFPVKIIAESAFLAMAASRAKARPKKTTART